MKKIILMAMITVMCMLSGCGNQSLGFGKYTFQKVHVDTYHHTGCFTVKKWHDDETGIEVKTEEAGSMFLSEGTYILIEKDCPFCEDGTEN